MEGGVSPGGEGGFSHTFLYSYVYHNMRYKIAGVWNTVGTIRNNVKLAFFKPVFKCDILNTST